MKHGYYVSFNLYFFMSASFGATGLALLFRDEYNSADRVKLMVYSLEVCCYMYLFLSFEVKQVKTRFQHTDLVAHTSVFVGLFLFLNAMEF